jgi:hypothetical protein
LEDQRIFRYGEERGIIPELERYLNVRPRNIEPRALSSKGHSRRMAGQNSRLGVCFFLPSPVVLRETSMSDLDRLSVWEKYVLRRDRALWIRRTAPQSYENQDSGKF